MFLEFIFINFMMLLSKVAPLEKVYGDRLAITISTGPLALDTIQAIRILTPPSPGQGGSRCYSRYSPFDYVTTKIIIAIKSHPDIR